MFWWFLWVIVGITFIILFYFIDCWLINNLNIPTGYSVKVLRLNWDVLESLVNLCHRPQPWISNKSVDFRSVGFSVPFHPKIVLDLDIPSIFQLTQNRHPITLPNISKFNFLFSFQQWSSGSSRGASSVNTIQTWRKFIRSTRSWTMSAYFSRF